MSRIAEDVSFDVALSYSSTDAGIARDLYHLITREGFSIYCYEFLTDYVKGFLRRQLQDIYLDSRVNVILWSKSYSQQLTGSFVEMERRFITERHVYKGDDKTLVVVMVDDTPLERDLADILAHSLKKEGAVGIARIILSRFHRGTLDQHQLGPVYHPSNTETMRGELHACSFFINPTYKKDRLGRWESLGDVLVELPGSKLGTYVYLIPSGLAIPTLRHSQMLRNDPRLLEQKQIATKKFAQEWEDRALEGSWFDLKIGQSSFQTVYSAIYDRYLNRTPGVTASSF